MSPFARAPLPSPGPGTKRQPSLCDPLRCPLQQELFVFRARLADAGHTHGRLIPHGAGVLAGAATVHRRGSTYGCLTFWCALRSCTSSGSSRSPWGTSSTTPRTRCTRLPSPTEGIVPDRRRGADPDWIDGRRFRAVGSGDRRPSDLLRLRDFPDGAGPGTPGCRARSSARSSPRAAPARASRGLPARLRPASGGGRCWGTPSCMRRTGCTARGSAARRASRVAGPAGRDSRRPGGRRSEQRKQADTAARPSGASGAGAEGPSPWPWRPSSTRTRSRWSGSRRRS